MKSTDNNKLSELYVYHCILKCEPEYICLKMNISKIEFDELIKSLDEYHLINQDVNITISY